MTPNHDSYFPDIHLFLTEMGLTVRQFAVRTFDLEWRENRTTITVHQFVDVGQNVGLGASINLMVWRGHMGFLLPSEDTRATSWRDWHQQVGHIMAHQWISWG